MTTLFGIVFIIFKWIIHFCFKHHRHQVFHQPEIDKNWPQWVGFYWPELGSTRQGRNQVWLSNKSNLRRSHKCRFIEHDTDQSPTAPLWREKKKSISKVWVKSKIERDERNANTILERDLIFRSHIPHSLCSTLWPLWNFLTQISKHGCQMYKYTIYMAIVMILRTHWSPLLKFDLFQRDYLEPFVLTHTD